MNAPYTDKNSIKSLFCRYYICKGVIFLTHLTGDNYASEVGRADRPVLIDFFSPTCAPCRALAPTFETLAAQYGDRYKFCKVDVDAQDDLTERFRILSVPTLVLLQDGEVIHRVSGVRSEKELKRIFDMN